MAQQARTIEARSVRLKLPNGRAFWRKFGIGYTFVLPALFLYSVFKLYPFLGSLYLSLTDWDGARQTVSLVGLGNYARLATDPLLWLSLGHNLLWVTVGTAAPIVLGLFLAMLLWGRVRGFTFFRTVYFMPVVLSSVIVAIIWGWIYHPIFGILNRGLQLIGLGALARGWLGEPATALYAILAAATWREIGFYFVIFLAGLQNVDLEIVDAARVDGANAWQRFRHVILPQLTHVVTMVTAIGLIDGFNAFDLVFVMTGGGPANSSELIATYTYRQAFMQSEVGYGAALSMVMTVLSLVVTLVFIRLRERGQA